MHQLWDRASAFTAANNQITADSAGAGPGGLVRRSKAGARRLVGTGPARWETLRQADDKMGPAAGRRVEVDPAPVCLDDPVADRQPQPRPTTDRLGREKRFEDLIADRRLDSRAGVDDVDFDLTRGESGADGHLPPSGQASRALFRRLSTTWLIWAG